MFGYVNILKDELKIKDYNTFRAYYCGLCKTLGRHNGTVSRFGLSYDMTFLLLVLSSIHEEDTEFSIERCIAHPVTKHKTACQNKLTEYVADMSCMLVYLKAKDDFSDEKSIKGLLGMLLYYPCIRRAKKRYRKIYDSITNQLNLLSQLEKEKCGDIDKTADCFAKITELLFSYSYDGEDKRKLSWLGYNIGRWIYIIDAIADYETDKKKNSYNPIIISNKEKNELELSLTLTLSNIASAYELLDVKRNDAILRNILYDGLLQKQRAILRKDTSNESI